MTDAQEWVRRWFEARGPIPGGSRHERLETDYFEAGLVDSLAVVGLVAELENAFGVRFEDRHYREPRFSTIRGLAEIVSELATSRSPLSPWRASYRARPRGRAALGEAVRRTAVLEHATRTWRLGVRLGVRLPSPSPAPLPYAADVDTLVFAAPLLSRLCGERLYLLRGWKAFDGCVKGFNALGLLARDAAREEAALRGLSRAGLLGVRRAFLAARGLARAPEEDLAALDLGALALWRAFARRTIVCSTSANLGICLHQALALLRKATVRVAGRDVGILGPDEGSLVIWCPDPRADFMSPEKSATLEALQAEAPGRTALKTYLNRRQRDPLALRDALAIGGYFYPTNPQSRGELERLLGEALEGLDRREPKVARALRSLDARVRNGRVVVDADLDAGMLGMAVPYLQLLEETLARGGERAVSVWNPASIGAALAGLTLADAALRGRAVPDGLAEFAPRLSAFARAGRLGAELKTTIDGVFDVANLQSLAQLFGVVVTRHFSGRQTAYVGLGSSSYANGNLCFEALQASAESGGAFGGRDRLHPATHTLNPVAQALIYGEDLLRAARLPAFAALRAGPRARAIRAHCRKPEPAGAAGLAGYLLARVDAGTLSPAAVAGALRAAGFTRELFLRLAGVEAAAWLRAAADEGPAMEAFARGLLASLARGGRLPRASPLLGPASREPRRSRAQRGSAPLGPAVHIHVTGDNAPQPSERLIARLLEAQAAAAGRRRGRARR